MVTIGRRDIALSQDAVEPTLDFPRTWLPRHILLTTTSLTFFLLTLSPPLYIQPLLHNLSIITANNHDPRQTSRCLCLVSHCPSPSSRRSASPTPQPPKLLQASDLRRSYRRCSHSTPANNISTAAAQQQAKTPSTSKQPEPSPTSSTRTMSSSSTAAAQPG